MSLKLRIPEGQFRQQLLEEIYRIVTEEKDEAAHPDGTEQDNDFGICESYWLATNFGNPLYLALKVSQTMHVDGLSEEEQQYLALRCPRWFVWLD